MAAPVGNRFWELRLRHGRKRVIQSPKALWDNAVQYFQWCEENPLMEAEQVKNPAKPYKTPDTKEGDLIIPGEWIVPAPIIEMPKMRAFTKGGFALACGLNAWKEIDALKEVSEDFSQVVTRIENVIYEQKFTGAAAGFLNPNIIARDLGLMEKTETNLKGNGFSFNLTMNKTDEQNDAIP